MSFVGQQPSGEELIRIGRRHLQVVDATSDHIVDDFLRIHPREVTQQMQLMASDHEQQPVHGGVEGERRSQRDPQAKPLGTSKLGAMIVKQIDQATMLNDHTLGLAGRA